MTWTTNTKRQRRRQKTGEEYAGEPGGQHVKKRGTLQRCSQEAKIEFAKKLLTFERGQIFVAEHIFGKAVQRTDLTTAGESLIIPILNNDSLADDEL